MMVDLAEARVALDLGDAARAFAVTSNLNHQFPGAGFLPLAEAIMGEALVATGEPERALALADQLARLTSHPAAYPAGLAQWVEGLAARAWSV
jgi:hypothetical protein